MQIGSQRLYTALDVAAKFKVSRRRVLQLAKHRQIGRLVGRQYLFTPEDVKALTPGPPGYPKGRKMNRKKKTEGEETPAR